MTYADVRGRFGQIRPPEDDWPWPWVSPYRLLFGAAYSIGKAEHLIRAGTGGEVPLDLSSTLTVAVDHPAAVEWFRQWGASYFLTSAIFRVASAAEKICGLATHRADVRAWLGDDARDRGSRLCTKIPVAHELLRRLPRKRNRVNYLRRHRKKFEANGTLASPLVCAIIQTDIDKHVPYKPRKDSDFDSTLAVLSFLEACELWDAAVRKKFPQRPTQP